MIILLKKNKDGTFDIVSDTEIFALDEFISGWDNTANKQKMQIINTIIEQRKERGTYEDESKRRMWAKVSAEQKSLNQRQFFLDEER